MPDATSQAKPRRARQLARLVPGLLALVLSAPSPANPTDGDLRLWTELLVSQHRGPRWTSYTWAESRFVDDMERLGTWLVQQKLYRRFSPGLSAGVGAATIHLVGRSGPDPHMERVEFDLMPRWQLDPANRIELRARAEQRWWQPDASRNGVMARVRLRWRHNFSGAGPLQHLEVSNEWFWDAAQHCYCENRLRLAEAHFRLSASTTSSTFLQVRSLRARADSDWDHAIVMGFGLRFEGFRMRQGHG